MKSINMIKSGLALTALAAVFQAPLAQAAAGQIDIPIVGLALFNPCTSELVVLDGNLHLGIRVTVDKAGGFHFGIHLNDQGISGVGVPSGNKYQGVGAANLTYNAVSSPGGEVTAVLNTQLVTPGRDNNLKLKLLLHITQNANGVITANVFDASLVCR